MQPDPAAVRYLYETLDYLAAARIDLHCDDPPERAREACEAIAESCKRIVAAIQALGGDLLFDC
jgi:hypothetical protein